MPARNKQLRRGEAFVDYLRNGRGATAVAAYSTRTKKAASSHCSPGATCRGDWARNSAAALSCLGLRNAGAGGGLAAEEAYFNWKRPSDETLAILNHFCGPEEAVWRGAMPVVLLVEDDEQVCVLAESMLQMGGHDTISATSKDEALAILKGDRSIDVLLTNVNLLAGKRDGLDLARVVVETRPGICILYSTSEPETDALKALLGSHLVAKPYTVGALNGAIQMLLGGRPGPDTGSFE